MVRVMREPLGKNIEGDLKRYLVQGERLKIVYAMPVKDRGEAGEVISDDLTVACGEGALKLLKVQRAGKGVMEARELLKGFPLPPGTRFA